MGCDPKHSKLLKVLVGVPVGAELYNVCRLHLRYCGRQELQAKTCNTAEKMVTRVGGGTSKLAVLVVVAVKIAEIVVTVALAV